MYILNRLSCVFTLLTLFITPALASVDAEIDFIAGAQKPPKGVVFEIIESSPNDLELALKKVEQYSEQLKESIPLIKISIVSHGSEQFALLNKNKIKFQSTHNKVKSLINDNVPVHVCGTHASWLSFTANDFPEYVDVAKTGPRKIREYQRQGYTLVTIEL